MENKIKINKVRKNKTINIKKILIISFIFSLFIIITIFYLINKKIDSVAKRNFANEKEYEVNKELVEKLSGEDEQKRTKIYIKDFLENIKKENYSIIYSKLYSEFKNNFFENIGDFEKYIKNNIPSNFAIEYKHFEVLGDLYIYRVDINNLDDDTKSLKDMYFIFKEEDLNKYIYSFSVKTPNDHNKDKLDNIKTLNIQTENNLNQDNINKPFDILEKLEEQKEKTTKNN